MQKICEICGRELLQNEECLECKGDLSLRDKLIEKIVIGFCFITVFGLFVKILFF